MIELVNWDRYQSEYQRQKKYRARRLRQSDSKSYTQSDMTEAEGESEGEVEKEEKQKRNSTAPPAVITQAFDALGHKPFGPKQFQEIWAEELSGAGASPNWTDIMEQTIQRCQSLKVKVPGLFYEHKHEIEKGQVKMRYKVTPP
jgi:hypothetical protein